MHFQKDYSLPKWQFWVKMVNLVGIFGILPKGLKPSKAQNSKTESSDSSESAKFIERMVLCCMRWECWHLMLLLKFLFCPGQSWDLRLPWTFFKFVEFHEKLQYQEWFFKAGILDFSFSLSHSNFLSWQTWCKKPTKN